jgi:ADP-ribose pyrophosphatase
VGARATGTQAHARGTPFTVILGDGLDEEVLSPQVRHLTSRANVGEREIERLCGRGRGFGKGPLPTFLKLALERGQAGHPVSLILLSTAEASASPEQHFAPPLDELAARSHVIPCQRGRIPWDELRRVVHERTGIDPAAPSNGSPGLRFLVVGCHTEERILALAVFLRRVFQSEEVAISSHLVGSAIPEAHLAVLRHLLPAFGVQVLLDLAEAARFASLDPGGLAEFDAKPCTIEPAEMRAALDAEQRQIIERLCMHWTRTRLRPLTGGFSGSLLLMAEGWKGEARTEPLVLKVEYFDRMRRELAGYYQVKDFLGKHVPTFGYPVTVGERIGVSMELAAREGMPETLQDTFERAEEEETTKRFFRRLERALALMVERLLRNTREKEWVVPYRDFGLHAEKQQRYLRDNAGRIHGYLAEMRLEVASIDVDQLVTMFQLITANEAGLESEVCLSHGDLNLANVICDQADNIWLIDWTHCGKMPLELDFAKIENDVKFVMTKNLSAEDLPRMRRLEEYLVKQRIPADFDALPPELAFVKWDLRFRKILGTVRRLRTACFSLKESEDWIVYRIALLRYAAHTLSFDERRGRGECGVIQLASALHSVEELVFELFSDVFHMRIRAERPPDYPPRLSITIDEAPWTRDCARYDPPYYVAPEVLASRRPRGWADPEELAELSLELAARPAEHRDAEGRPLNPMGRTGIAGRGLLGLWGSNLSVAAVLVRPAGDTGELEVALGHRAGETRLELPKGFVLHREDPGNGIRRVLEVETGIRGSDAGEPLFEGYTYDPRETDHAWVETHVFLFFDAERAWPDLLAPGGDFEELMWWPLDPETFNRVPSAQARFLRAAVKRLVELGHLGRAAAESLLESTG